MKKEIGVRRDSVALLRQEMMEAARPEAGTVKILKPMVLKTSTGRVIEDPTQLTNRAMQRRLFAMHHG